LAADQPLNVDRRADLARSYYHRARLYERKGDIANATRDIAKAVELYTGIPPKGPEDIYFQACLKSMHAGLLDKEGTGPAKAQARRLVVEAIVLLKQAAAAGYANPHRFDNDAALNALRGHADFNALRQSLPKGLP
jgi:hypothetical protein